MCQNTKLQMNTLPEIETFTSPDAVVKNMQEYLDTDVWVVCVTKGMTPEQVNTMWNVCLGGAKNCQDSSVNRSVCTEKHEIVYYNTNTEFDNIGRSFGVGHISTPEYQRQQLVRTELSSERGCRTHLLTQLEAGKQVFMYFGGYTPFRITVFKKILDNVYVSYSMYKENFICLSYITDDPLSKPINLNPEPNLQYTSVQRKNSEI
jgi:hypothetical protein